MFIKLTDHGGRSGSGRLEATCVSDKDLINFQNFKVNVGSVRVLKVVQPSVFENLTWALDLFLKQISSERLSENQ